MARSRSVMSRTSKEQLNRRHMALFFVSELRLSPSVSYPSTTVLRGERSSNEIILHPRQIAAASPLRPASGRQKPRERTTGVLREKDGNAADVKARQSVTTCICLWRRQLELWPAKPAKTARLGSISTTTAMRSASRKVQIFASSLLLRRTESRQPLRCFSKLTNVSRLTGLAKWWSKPACLQRRSMSSWPDPVTATRSSSRPECS